MVFAKKSKDSEITPQDMMKQIAAGLKKQATSPNMHAYQPHRKQNIFHRTRKKIRLYIGGNRSGKTVGGVIEDLWWATGRHPYFDVPTPCFGRVVSVDFVNGIEKIIIPIFKRWVIESDLRGGSWEQAYDKQERTLHFANGSFIEFMSYDQDLDKFAGTSRHFIHFDEEPPKHIYTENLLRTVDVDGYVWITMTPVDGMTWVYDDLYEKGKDNDDPNLCVVEVAIHENPHLDPTAIEIILSMLDADERAAREKGQFVQVGGLIYKDFKKDPDEAGTHVFRSDPTSLWLPPKDWQIITSVDHGFNNPTAWLWHGVSPDGDLVTFYEHYLSGWTIDQHASHYLAINKRLGITPDFAIGDPSIRNKDPITGTSIWEEYARLGIPILLGNNDVSAGIVRTARYIRTKGGSGQPKWRVASVCVSLIREMGRYRWATYTNKNLNFTNNAHEKPHKKDDHACDSLRYFIMSRPDLVADGIEVKSGALKSNEFDSASSWDPHKDRSAPKVLATVPKYNSDSEYDLNSGWETDELGAGW
jgi:phage terminase large subunit-like protein